jgi:hypothetical protein
MALSKLPSAAFETTGRRNLIINGAMQVAQRDDEVTGVTSGSGTAAYRTVDRHRFEPGTLGTWTVSQSTDAPDGFSYSHKVLCTTADASPAASDYLLIHHTKIEGQDLQHLNFGSSDAKSLTLSFWVKSNKTGNASVNILNVGSTRTAHPQYTINAADTWEYKTVTVSGDTSNGITDSNASGLEILFWGNSGSTFTGGSHRTTFGSRVNADRNASNLGLGGAVNDYWQITGLQLEVGDSASPFEHRSYGEELALCQRYCQRLEQSRTNALHFGRGWAGTTAQIALPLFCELRSVGVAHDGNGSLTKYGDMAVNAYASDGNNITGFSNFTTSGAIVTMLATLSSSVTAGGNTLWWSMDNDAYFIIEDEL